MVNQSGWVEVMMKVRQLFETFILTETKVKVEK